MVALMLVLIEEIMEETLHLIVLQHLAVVAVDILIQEA